VLADFNTPYEVQKEGLRSVMIDQEIPADSSDYLWVMAYYEECKNSFDMAEFTCFQVL
jgi:hypothetical protein